MRLVVLHPLSSDFTPAWSLADGVCAQGLSKLFAQIALHERASAADSTMGA
jgi:hypothetical protein